MKRATALFLLTACATTRAPPGPPANARHVTYEAESSSAFRTAERRADAEAKAREGFPDGGVEFFPETSSTLNLNGTVFELRELPYVCR